MRRARPGVEFFRATPETHLILLKTGTVLTLSPAAVPNPRQNFPDACKLGFGRLFVATALVHYTAAAVTDRGRKRTSNEDSFGFSVEHGVYLVCDGMGGAAAGEVASSLAVDEVMRLLANAEVSPMPHAAESAVGSANEAILSRAQRNPRLSGMGTTLVGLVIRERKVWVLNIGDSRCYLMRNRKLEQVTEDHSLVEEQVRLGKMTHLEALRSPLRNVITRALGTQSSVTPDIVEIEAEPGDVFMLCSDGLTRELTDPLIETHLGQELPLEELCARLVLAAKKAGGHDNITCLLVRAGG
jgi:protein phosphatase